MMRIYVGNLEFDVSETEIRRRFERFGAVHRVEIAKDWETGHSRGFGFVEMPDPQGAERAIQALNGQELNGRKMTVRQAPQVPPIGFDSLPLAR